MKKFKINGKDMTPEEVLDFINLEDSKVESLSFILPNENKKKDIPLNSNGFDISKEVLAEMCDYMDEMSASECTITLSNSPHIKGRTLIITMKDSNE